MRLVITSVTSLVLLVLAATTFVELPIISRLSSIIIGSASSQAPLIPNSPACADLTKVQGPVIEFGRQGDFSYSVTINSQGQITTTAVPIPLPSFPSIRPKVDHVAPSTVNALVRLARAENFWTLPEIIGQGSNPSPSPMFVTINLACASHTVVLHDGAKANQDVARFAEMYTLLSDLVSGEEVAYKPLK
jgi:hypothetical protein